MEYGLHHLPINAFKEIGHDTYTIYLSGELDASNSLVVADALKKAAASQKKNVWVDFEHLQYISSNGLGVILSYYHTFKAKNINLVLCQMSPKIKDVFCLLGLDALIPMVDTLEEARAFNEQQEKEPPDEAQEQVA